MTSFEGLSLSASVAAGRKKQRVPLAPIHEDWPYGNFGHPIVESVNRSVPKYIPYEIRCDICQDMCLAIVGGVVTLSDLDAARKLGFRAVYKAFKNKWGPVSLAQPLGKDGGMTVGDMVQERTSFADRLHNALLAAEIDHHAI